MPDATMTLTLAAFLEARLAEDEAVALGGISGQADPESGWGYEGRALTPHVGIVHEAIQAAHIIRWHPARVLAEIAAKRAIMAEHRLITDPARLVKVWRDPTPGVACERCANDPLGDAPLEDIGPCDTWLHLAAVYSDHPDYDESWAVS